MTEGRGIVYIAPVASHIPSGRMVDPRASVFWVSWQDWDDEAELGELMEDDNIVGAEAAIAWGRQRGEGVLIRLAHDHGCHFSAGPVHLTEQADGSGQAFPTWPPDGPPQEGWWSPSDEARAVADAIKTAREQPTTARLGWSEPIVRIDPDDRDGPDALK